MGRERTARLKRRHVAAIVALAGATTAAALGTMCLSAAHADDGSEICADYEHSMDGVELEHPPYIQTPDTRYIIEAWDTPVLDGVDYVLKGCATSWDDGSIDHFTIAASYRAGINGENVPSGNAVGGEITTIDGRTYDVVAGDHDGVVDTSGGELNVANDEGGVDTIYFHVK